MDARPPGDVLVVLPAWNEEHSVGLVVKETVAALGDAACIVVVDDGSTDRTAEVARQAGAEVIGNLFNLGVGGAMRVGFRWAALRGHRFLVQVDADGQHDPRDIPALLAALDDGEVPEVVIGARFAGRGDFRAPRARRWAMRLLAAYLSHMTRTPLTDVTSGFRAYNRAAIELFARTYPAEYLSDTVESLVIASRAGARITQVPVTMRPRYAGAPSHSSGRATLYLARVGLILILSLIRRRPDPASRKEGP